MVAMMYDDVEWADGSNAEYIDRATHREWREKLRHDVDCIEDLDSVEALEELLGRIKYAIAKIKADIAAAKILGNASQTQATVSWLHRATIAGEVFADHQAKCEKIIRQMKQVEFEKQQQEASAAMKKLRHEQYMEQRRSESDRAKMITRTVVRMIAQRELLSRETLDALYAEAVTVVDSKQQSQTATNLTPVGGQASRRGTYDTY